VLNIPCVTRINTFELSPFLHSLLLSLFLSILSSTSTNKYTDWSFKIKHVYDSDDVCHISCNLHCRICPYHLFKNYKNINQFILETNNSLPYPNPLNKYDGSFSRIRERRMSPKLVFIFPLLIRNIIQSARINSSKLVFRYSWTIRNLKSRFGGELAYRRPALQRT